MTRDLYDRLWKDAGEVRQWLELLIQTSPELFPAGIKEGFQLTGLARIRENAWHPVATIAAQEE